MRILGSVTLLVFLAHVLVPAFIVTDFLVDQERIARELCVQRLVPEDMRSCHGHCYLSKRLKDVDERERDLPVAFRALKLDEAVAQRQAPRVLQPLEELVAWPRLSNDRLLPGHVLVSEPVPWC